MLVKKLYTLGTFEGVLIDTHIDVELKARAQSAKKKPIIMEADNDVV